MRHAIWMTAGLLTSIALGLTAWTAFGRAESAPGPLREHRSEVVRLAHPPAWTVTHDTFDLADDDSHFIALGSDDDAALLLSIFGGETGIILETFAARYGSHLDASATMAGHAISASPTPVGRIEARIFGRSHSGLVQDFTLARGLARQVRRMAFFKVARDDREYFIVINARRAAWEQTIRDAEQILASLRPEPRIVAVDSGRSRSDD